MVHYIFQLVEGKSRCLSQTQVGRQCRVYYPASNEKVDALVSERTMLMDTFALLEDPNAVTIAKYEEDMATCLTDLRKANKSLGSTVQMHLQLARGLLDEDLQKADLWCVYRLFETWTKRPMHAVTMVSSTFKAMNDRARWAWLQLVCSVAAVSGMPTEPCPRVAGSTQAAFQTQLLHYYDEVAFTQETMSVEECKSGERWMKPPKAEWFFGKGHSELANSCAACICLARQLAATQIQRYCAVDKNMVRLEELTAAGDPGEVLEVAFLQRELGIIEELVCKIYKGDFDANLVTELPVFRLDGTKPQVTEMKSAWVRQAHAGMNKLSSAMNKNFVAGELFVTHAAPIVKRLKEGHLAKVAVAPKTAAAVDGGTVDAGEPAAEEEKFTWSMGRLNMGAEGSNSKSDARVGMHRRTL
jgi:hypothetical protein